MLHARLRAAAGSLGGWSPEDIATAVWLDASDSSTITISTGVSNWSDKSSNSRNATQDSSSLQPALLAGALNGLDAVYFDGLDDGMLLPDISSFSSASVFCVLSQENDPPDQFKSGIWAFGTASASSHHPFSDGVIYESFGTTSRKTCGDPSFPLSSAHIYSVESANNDWKCRINSSLFFSTTSNSVGLTASPYIGTANDNNHWFNGIFAEIVLLDYIPSQSDREKIEGYLAHKWGIESTLPLSHPYKNGSP